MSYFRWAFGLFLLAFSYSSLAQTRSSGNIFSNGMKASELYRVFVDGKEIEVYQSPVPASYASFTISDRGSDIEIIANRDVKWVDVRPLSKEIDPLYEGNKIKFRLAKAANLSIELNGSTLSPLFLFTNEPTKIVPQKGDYIFKGNKIHYAGLIELKDNQSVYIEEGSVVVGVIHAKNAKNINVFGGGILDGSYNKTLNDSIIASNLEAKALENMRGSGHRFLQFEDCKNVFIKDVILHNSTSWQIVPVRCENVQINNVKIVSDQPSDDGIDIVSSKNVLIKNCFIRTKDDCIAIKAPAFFGNPLNVENVQVKNCVFWNAVWGNGVEIGFELDSKEIKDIIFDNNDIIHIEGGAALSIHNAGKAHVKNITFQNIRIEDARQKLFDVAIFRSQYSPDKPKDKETNAKLYLHGAWDGVIKVPQEDSAYHAGFRGKISNVVFKNISIVDGAFPYSIFNGFDKTHNVENVLIENFRVHGKKITNKKEAKFYIKHTDNITIK